MAQIPDVMQEGRGSEFFVGRIEGKPLVKVQLLSGVHFPGVYHIPVNTNLAGLIAYAGGAVELADLDDVSVRSTSGEKSSVRNYDLSRIIKKNETLPEMQENDIVRIPTDTVDSLNKAYIWTGIFGILSTAALSVVLIHQNSKTP